MKIAIFSDVHWSTYSSLVRSRGDEFSFRLEQLIRGMDWVNRLAVEQGCSAMICAGDFMDKAQLTDEEITALKRIRWNSLECIFLCGNHESSVSDLRYSSLKAVESTDPMHKVLSEPTLWNSLPECDVFFLPYIVESDRKPLVHYLEEAGLKDRKKPLVIVSHNDIAGINYGGFESKIGFSTKEIDENCDLYLNGHLHNSEWVTKKALNVGSMTAHNFTNDSARYRYGAWVLDTETLKLEFFENPYGLAFYKIDIESEKDLKKLDGLKFNSVLSIKCAEDALPALKEKLEKLKSAEAVAGTKGSWILENRITAERKPGDAGTEVTISELQSDHIGKFAEFCRNTLAASKALDIELAEICK